MSKELLQQANEKIPLLKAKFKMIAFDERVATPEYAKYHELYQGILLAEKLTKALADEMDKWNTNMEEAPTDGTPFQLDNRSLK